jgi:hypothetical protein
MTVYYSHVLLLKDSYSIYIYIVILVMYTLLLFFFLKISLSLSMWLKKEKREREREREKPKKIWRQYEIMLSPSTHPHISYNFEIFEIFTQYTVCSKERERERENE